MIGGFDVVLPATGDSAALDLWARILQHYWPQARFEDAVTGEKYGIYGGVPIGRVRELLVYPNAEAESAWDADSPETPPIP